MKVFDKPANVIVPIFLFVLFTPGLFFNLVEKTDKYVLVVVHALAFGALYALLLTLFSNYY